LRLLAAHGTARLQVTVVVDEVLGFAQKNDDLFPPAIDERAAHSLYRRHSQKRNA
jgi:hypothetical protein